jgi:hypothetical protein
MSKNTSGLRGIWALVLIAAGGGCASVGGASAGSGKENLAVMPDNPDALIQMRRSACAVGPCSSYGVSIFLDGTVVYDGRQDVAVIGQRKAQMPPERVSELISMIDSIGFLDLPQSCCLCHGTSAYQLVTLDYRPGSVQRTILHDTGCTSALTDLERLIDSAAGTQRWTSPAVVAEATPVQAAEPSVADPSAELVPPPIPLPAPARAAETGSATTSSEPATVSAGADPSREASSAPPGAPL